MKHKTVFIGFDPREAAAFAVARSSVRRNLTQQIPVYGVVLSELQEAGLYTRPTKKLPNGRLIDELSIRSDYDGSMSTQHAIARFLVPFLAGSGWSLFMDGDVLVRKSLARIFERLDENKAIYCVKHRYEPEIRIKMDGQVQTKYSRKNWSSVVIWNVDHPANKVLTLEAINTLPGKNLHQFCWLEDDLIGELDPKWNWLVGHSNQMIDPAIVHFTSGVPDMPGYEHCQYSDEWRKELSTWAGCNGRTARAKMALV